LHAISVDGFEGGGRWLGKWKPWKERQWENVLRGGGGFVFDGQ